MPLVAGKQFSASLVFAHRGANHEAPENLRSAFDKALNYAIDGIETDVQLSRDAVAVLWHDRFLGKLPGQESCRIDDFDYAQLSTMNFAQHFSNDCVQEGIMRLQDFLNAYRKRCRLLIEIKNRDWEKPERHAIKLRQTLDMVGNDHEGIFVSSFNLDSLVYAQQYRPGFPLIYNFEPEQTLADAEQVLRDHPFLHGLCVHIDTLDTHMVQLLHGLNKLIAVYTCNSDEEIMKALHLGVDILISDLPQKALLMRGT